MALVTLQRSPSPSNSPDRAESEGDVVGEEERSPLRQRRSKSAIKRLRKFFNTIRFISKLNSCFSESYFAVKGAALILPQSECSRKVTSRSHGGDIQSHLQSMLHLLRSQDTLKVAVKLESNYPKRNRYMAVVSCIGRQDTEECVILGIDCNNEKATIGLVLPIYANTKIKLDGDGGFSINTEGHHHLMKPVSVQAMWSALQSLHKVVNVATSNHYLPHGLTHTTWVGYYQAQINSDQLSINEWHLMEDIQPFRSESNPFFQENPEQDALKLKIKVTLREIMMTVDLEEVTSKFLRTTLEEQLGMSLQEHKSYVDEEMLIIMGQMDAPTQVFDYLYLGSEWNASNLEELQENGIGYLLNVTREIDNFFPGMFTYMNIREYDVEETDLLKYFEKTYKFIHKVRKAGAKVLVHCKMGISRSASTVIAYIMKDRGWSLEETYDFVKQKRSCVKPNKGFMKQLEIYQGILNASRQRFIFKSKSETNLTETGDILEDLTDPHGEGIFLGETLHLTRPHSWGPEDEIAASILQQKGLALSDDGEEYGSMFRLGGDDADVELSSRSTDSVEMSLPDIPSPTNIKPDDHLASHQFVLPVPSSSSSYITSANGGSGGIIIHRENRDWKSRGKSPSVSPMGSPKGDGTVLGAGPPMLSGSFPNSTPYAIRVRDDHSWIKEASPDSPATVEAEGLVLPVEEPQYPDTGDPDGGVNFYITEDCAEPEIPAVSTCTLQQRLYPSESEPVSMSISHAKSDSSLLRPEMGIHQHYVKEAIPWHPGMVRKQLQDFEQRIRCENTNMESFEQDPCAVVMSNPDETLLDDQAGLQTMAGYSSQSVSGPGQMLLPIPNPAVRESHSFHGLSTPPEDADEGLRVRPASVYEIEDIQLPVGIVQRTKQEIEEKQRPTPREWIETSFSDLDPMSKPVQRSSSLKVDQSKTKSRKSRSSDRRKTCTPILSPGNVSPVASLSILSPPGQQASTSHAPADSTALQLPVQVFKYGSEEVPLELGKVRRHTQGYENLTEIRLKGLTCAEGTPDYDDETNVFFDNSEKNIYASDEADDVKCTDWETETGNCGCVEAEQGEVLKHSEGTVLSRVNSSDVDDTSANTGDPMLRLSQVMGICLRDPAGEKELESNQCATKDSMTSTSSTVEHSANTNSISSTIVQSQKSPHTHMKKDERKRESCLDKQTLFLIREIGSALLNQPMKTHDDETDSAGENVSLVKQLVKRIERKSEVKPKSFLDHIVIIDKDTLSKPSVPTTLPSQKTTDAEVPCNMVEQIVGQSKNGNEIVQKMFASTVTLGEMCASNSGEMKDTELEKRSALDSTERHAKLSSLSLDLDTDSKCISSPLETAEVRRLASPRDELRIDGLEAIEDDLVKNLVGKFEVKDVAVEEVKRSTESEQVERSTDPGPLDIEELKDMSTTCAEASTSVAEPVELPVASPEKSPPSVKRTKEDPSLSHTLTRSASLEDIWTLHRVSDAANVTAEISPVERSNDNCHPTSDTNVEDSATSDTNMVENPADRPIKTRPVSVILTSTCSLGELRPTNSEYRRNVRSLSSLTRTSNDASRSGPHQFLPSETINLDGRKVRRLEGRTHPLAKLGWQHSTM